MLQLPSSKLFLKIFEFVMKQIDPRFKYGNKPEDDILDFVKGLHYPYNLSRSSLQQAGTPHTWPPLLAMLNWLVQTINFSDATSGPGTTAAQPAHLTPRRFEAGPLTNLTSETSPLDEEGCRAVFFEFMKESYNVFMNTEDETISDAKSQEMMQLFTTYFEEARQEVALDVENLKTELSRKEATLERMQDKSELKKLQEDKEILEKLLSDLIKETQRGEKDLQGYEEVLLDKQQELKKCAEITAGIQEDNALLCKRIQEQRFSKDDIEHMEEKLARRKAVLQMLKENRMHAGKEASKVEIQKVKIMEEIGQAAKKFNQRAARLKLIPPSNKHAEGRCFSIQINPHAKTAQDMMSDSMPKADIRAAIQQVKEKYNSKEQRLHAELTQLDMELAEESEAVEKLAVELETTEKMKKRDEEEVLAATERAKQEVEARLEDVRMRAFAARTEIENRAATLESLRQKSQDCDMEMEKRRQEENKEMEKLKERTLRLESMLDYAAKHVHQANDLVTESVGNAMDALEKLPS
ncbi:hypothetical protein CLOM_g2444 [Closterium sp. NIES-68]|nr:hypothetical protein CLOM_g2444 [Closterium sp. NIES-68]GJP74372.1 hypothetical protein CLOP_g4962 [Closterium sp. NIES-67]